jgi:hypothetical protein
MNDPRINFETLRYKAIRDKLLADDPEIDERTLADTTEGLTDLHELLAAVVRGALEDEARAVGLRVRIADMTKRLGNLEARAERRRQNVRDVMLDTGIQKLMQDDFSASLRNAPPHVVVIDEALIPETFWEHRPHLRKRELSDALKDGAEIAGAVLSNSGMSLSVRTK